MQHTVAVIVGSPREKSLSRNVAKALMSIASDNLILQEVPIAHLPLYNSDLDGDNAPQAWVDFREEVSLADAILFVTPEYNRSIPAGLKNALDVASRPYGENVWSGKPAAVVSVSPGGVGGFGANHHLRQILVCVDVYPLQQPEMYIGNAAKLFGEGGSINSTETRHLLAHFMDAFERHISAIAG